MGPKVFLDYDQEQLDRVMDLRSRWPEHQDYFDRWASESAAVRAVCPHEADLAYGDTAGQRLDLFLPAEGARPFPLLAFIHGGYWRALDKGDYSYLAPPFLTRGVAFASLNYDLAPGVGIADIVAQVRRGLAWLLRQAGTYDIDASGLCVAGHSAGGHLAAMAMNPDWTGEYGLPDTAVKGGCSVSGLYDLEPVFRSFKREEIGLDLPTVQTQSPLRDLPAHAAPLILAVGSEETAEFLRQQAVFETAWRDRGHACEVVPLPGENHFSSVDRLGQTGHPLFEAVMRMVRPPKA